MGYGDIDNGMAKGVDTLIRESIFVGIGKDR